MERLTKRKLKGEEVVCNIKIGQLNSCPDCNDSCMYGMCKWQKKANEKLKHYEDLEEQGLLLKLPCKIGDTIYHLECEGKIGEGICKAFQVDEENKMVWMEGKEFAFWVSFERFGKTVFLTKEEAEAKLRELQEKEK